MPIPSFRYPLEILSYQRFPHIGQIIDRNLTGKEKLLDIPHLYFRPVPAMNFSLSMDIIYLTISGGGP